MISLDHFILRVPNIETGITDFYTQTGVRPKPGGMHPHSKTHNALASLGESYLELLSGGHNALISPALTGWCLRTDSFQSLAESLKKYELILSNRSLGERKTLEGKIIKYEYAFIQGFEENVSTPFFLRWDDHTTPPHQDSPKGCTLHHFRVEQNSEKLLLWLQSLHLGIETELKSLEKITLQIQSPLRTKIQFESTP